MGKGLACRQLGFVHHPDSTRRRVVLDRIDVDFKAGQITLITGDTGVGKTTLLDVLAGIRRPTSGTVLADDLPVSRWTTPHRDRWRRKVGMVFQTHHLVGDLTVRENVMLPLIPRSMSSKELQRRTWEALERLQLTHLETNPVVQLSGGERQRVAIARAIVSEPHYLLADEPTAHQDRRAADMVLQVLAHTAVSLHSTVVVTAHDPRAMAAGAITRSFSLSRGKLIELQ